MTPTAITFANAGFSVAYDFENRIVTRDDPTVANDTVSIKYNGDGQRVEKTVQTGPGTSITTRYLVDDLNPTGFEQVILEAVVGQNAARQYVYGLDLISQRRQTGTSTFVLSFYGYDGHGSVRQLTDSSGALTDTYTYDAFGNLIAQTFTGAAPTPNHYLYAGEQFDADLNLYYNRARYLDVRSGRFWSMDEFEGDPQSPASLHKYLYSSADPIGNVDPSGRSLVELNIGQAMQLTLAALNILSGGLNLKNSIEFSIVAYDNFQQGDMWNGTIAAALGVVHIGFAALSMLGVKGAMLPPPPPTIGVVAAAGGTAALQVGWRIATANPAFARWVWGALWPSLASLSGVFLASSQSPHRAEWELRDSGGRIKTRGNETSGGTHPGRRLSWPEQSATHTEQKILDQIRGRTEPGDILTIRGSNPPCRACGVAMSETAAQRGLKILYSVRDRIWAYLSGTDIAP
jgi:RHS repeat-associated protein